MAVNPSASKQDSRCLKANTDIVEKHGSTYAKLTKIRYTWTIHNYSFHQKKTGDSLLSPTFSAGANNKYKWLLRAYPNGNKAEVSDYLSLFLSFVPTEECVVEARGKMCLLNDKKQEINLFNTDLHTYSKTGNSRGCSQFVKKSFLKNAANCLLLDGSLTILCEISIYEGIIEVSDPEEFEVPECPILDNLSDLFESLKHSDVTLVTPGREFQAHKVILAMCSPVFSAMFQSGMLEQKKNRVDIADVDDAVLMELLRFIYTGKIINLDKIAEGLLAAADKYQLKSLKGLCEKSLSKGPTIENAANLLILSDLHSCVQLKARVLNFFCVHANEIFATAGYKSMCDTHPYLINEAFQAFVSPIDLSGSTVVPVIDRGTATRRLRFLDQLRE